MRWQLWTRHSGDDPSSIDEVAKDALSKLQRLSNAGIGVPDDVRRPIIIANAALATGTSHLHSDQLVDLYECLPRLAVLSARLDQITPDEEKVADPYLRAVVNSATLLKFAAEHGKAVNPTVKAPLLAAQAKMDGSDPDCRISRTDFYSAYAELSKEMGEVTAHTIRASRTMRSRPIYLRAESWAVLLAILTVVPSIWLFAAESIDKQLTGNMDKANELAITIRSQVEQQNGVMQYIGAAACSEKERSNVTESKTRSKSELESLQHLAIAIRDTLSSAKKLNGMMFFFGTNSRSDAEDEDLQLNPAIANYSAEFLCKVKTWQGIRDFSQNVHRTFRAYVGAAVAHLLPVCYALLGACAFCLRGLGESIRKCTYHPSAAEPARMITAAIVGTVASLFTPLQEVSLSPLAVAFILGYGVEAFYRFLDGLLTRLLSDPRARDASPHSRQGVNDAGLAPLPPTA